MMLLSPGRSLWECPILPSEVLFIMLIFSLTGVLFIWFFLIGGGGRRADQLITMFCPSDIMLCAIFCLTVVLHAISGVLS